jgi:tetratricopeptide (TPR) repeat protein
LAARRRRIVTRADAARADAGPALIPRLTPRLLASAFAAALLGSCGGSSEPRAPIDPVLERQTTAGQTALALDRPNEAVRQFGDALARARERDDAAAIGDLGFDLAVAQLQAGEPAAALATARATAAELTRRAVPPPVTLQLAEAIALYRTAQAPAADEAAARVEQGGDASAAARAAFLRGLIADDRGDSAGLQAAQARVAAAKGPEHATDATELAARFALRTGDLSRARVAAEQAAAMRRELLDYRGLARCLALAASAAERAGDRPAAADLYFRAGRSAAARGEGTLARDWLERAIVLSHDPVLTAAARAGVASLRPRGTAHPVP